MTWTNGARRGLLVLISAAVISLLVTYSQDVQRFLPLEAIVQGDATDALTEGEVKPSARPGEEATVATAEKNAERNAHAEKNMKEVATFTATYEPTTADPVSRVRAREKSGVEGASSFGYATLAAGERFESLNARRKAHLLDRCHALEQAQRMPFARGNRIINVKPVLQVCVSPKSGSSSWRKLKKQLRARRLVSRRPLTALSVRHPLARLKSAYRKVDDTSIPGRVWSSNLQRVHPAPVASRIDFIYNLNYTLAGEADGHCSLPEGDLEAVRRKGLFTAPLMPLERHATTLLTNDNETLTIPKP
ncbi:uncharacterized protein LOC125041462 isoform X2 [Penaeus chinensis]|uniref:uncharacterized protein LOC125041462 isoform X2 n=1 Tax=Penaeus chinensis TaxID=139456 RepID=UPI001FB78CE8|nr:uncharacterized protein LOC125041462 isoform X2 [Penaeus chinensis]